jgi:sec-independent protein translocase protein TatA
MRIGPFGIWEILIILVVVLLVFGPRRLPEMAKGLGQSVRAFRKEMRDIKADLDLDAAAPRTTAPASTSATTASSATPPSSETAPAATDRPTDPVRVGGDGRA